MLANLNYTIEPRSDGKICELNFDAANSHTINADEGLKPG